MQEIHSIGGGRFFGGPAAGDRRLRPHHHHNNHQALKCPRCDSLNTKFCYYNNYNLSQPRHFCKNCRRYWTKGGVLRNVPVGGGCRKSKRSNNNNKTPKNSSSETVPAPPEHNSNSHSSSESSSLTAANTTAAAAAANTEAVSAPTLISDSNNNTNNTSLENMHESKLLIPSSNSALGTRALEQQQGAVDCGIFSEIGSFTSLITSSNDALAFGFGSSSVPEASSFQWQNQKVMAISSDIHHGDGELKLPESLSAGPLLDHGTVPVDLSALQNKTGHGGFGPLDWHGGGDQGLFDLSNTVDQPYWTHTHWSDHDNSTLFHLP